MRSFLKLLLIFFLTCSFAKLFASEFNSLFYSGKWANAKVWLLQNKSRLSKQDYYIKHLQLGYFLNEHELCKVYCDSLEHAPEYSNSVAAKITNHILLSKYYQYHKKTNEAILHAEQALKIANALGSYFDICLANAQMAIALRYSENKQEIEKRSKYVALVNAQLKLLPDSFYLYKAKIIQALSLIDVDRLSKGENTPEMRNKITRELYASNDCIEKKQAFHPQLIHNYLLLGFIRVAVDVDSALVYYKKAERALAKINDGHHGILIYHAASFNHLMEVAYEIKYRQTGNDNYLNKAIVWAKQSIDIDELKKQYEGYYLYRRYIDHYNIPAEQRITKLYLMLYKKTGNGNYLSFATKYAEFFRHKPIMQSGLNAKVYGILQDMVNIENGLASSFKIREDYTSSIITKPEAVAPLLKNNQAIIAYFSYSNEAQDSVSFMIEYIEREKNTILFKTYAKSEIENISEGIYKAVNEHKSIEYKQHAYNAYQLFIEPLRDVLNEKIRHLIIIQPAYYSTPLQFDGFLKSNKGTSFENYHYLFDSHNINYVTSFTQFVAHYKTNIIVKDVSIWNPDYTKTQLAELTENEKINAVISKYFSCTNLQYNSKKELVNQLFNGEILQVSGHASASFDKMQRPCIYTGINADSVLLDIDLERLQTHTELAIYAACKSNVGNVQHNGIVDGFTRASLSAGIGGTLCTIYNVEESTTADLLVLFYENIAKGYSSSEALYLAKTSLKRNNPDPKLWQAYIYTGTEQNFIMKSNKNPMLFIIACLLFCLINFALLKSNFN